VVLSSSPSFFFQWWTDCYSPKRQWWFPETDGNCVTWYIHNFLSVEEALVCHPLFVATHALTTDDLFVGTSIRHGGGRTNESSVRQWLDPVNPFYLAFNVLLVPTAEVAKCRLLALFKK
jgi:hypothetical protein